MTPRRPPRSVVVAGLALSPALSFALNVSNPPNIVVICADDMGIGDVGAYGAKDIPTPYIDSIAKAGVLCKQGYVVASQCGPSRAGLLTGRYPQRFGYEFNFSEKEEFEHGVPLNETLVFTRMKNAMAQPTAVKQKSQVAQCVHLIWRPVMNILLQEPGPIFYVNF